MTYICIYIV